MIDSIIFRHGPVCFYNTPQDGHLVRCPPLLIHSHFATRIVYVQFQEE